MYLPSRLQKYWVTGRAVSAVIGLAASNGSSVRLTQMLRVPLKGLMNAMNLPSGEICAPEISGSPKNNSRSISGGKGFACPNTGRSEVAINKPQMTANTKASDLRLKLRICIEPLSFGLIERIASREAKDCYAREEFRVSSRLQEQGLSTRYLIQVSLALVAGVIDVDNFQLSV